jgi:hypothetical protein
MENVPDSIPLQMLEKDVYSDFPPDSSYMHFPEPPQQQDIHLTETQRALITTTSDSGSDKSNVINIAILCLLVLFMVSMWLHAVYISIKVNRLVKTFVPPAKLAPIVAPAAALPSVVAPPRRPKVAFQPISSDMSPSPLIAF